MTDDDLEGVIITKASLKTEAVLPAREGVAYDYASLRRMIEERLGGA